MTDLAMKRRHCWIQQRRGLSAEGRRFFLELWVKYCGLTKATGNA